MKFGPIRMVYMRVVYEKYDSIKDFVDIITKRGINTVFRGKSLASDDRDYKFSKTHSLSEALNLLKDGYKEPLGKIKESLKATNINKTFQDIPKVRPTNNVIGFVPHVPNSILGLPQSMINVQKTPNKVRVVSIKYDMSIRAGCPADDIEKSGIVLLKIVNTLELRGYRVALDVIPFNGINDNELATVCVKVKDYKQPLDILKLCFPLAHPAFFRRIGFKWLETVPTLTESGFTWGYGRAVANESYEEALKLYSDSIKDFNKNSYYFNIRLAQRMGFNAEKIMEKTNLIKLME